MAAFLRLFGMLTAGGTLAAYGVLGSGNPANAAANSHVRHVRHVEHLAHPGAGAGVGVGVGVGVGAGASKRKANVRRSAAEPWTIQIPAIGLTADLMTLGDPNGVELPVPPLSRAATDAGWYRFTSVPGTAGNSVIVGHVDTYVGAAVFYNLYRLRRRDLIYVDLSGTRQRFAVSSVRELAKARFPVNQVFGITGRPLLWLITCGGAFDYQSGHYLDNIIVSATWDPTSKKPAQKKQARQKPANNDWHARPRVAGKEPRRAMPAVKHPARNEFS